MVHRVQSPTRLDSSSLYFLNEVESQFQLGLLCRMHRRYGDDYGPADGHLLRLLYVLAKNRLKQYTFTSDRSLTLSISLGFSLRRVVHVSGRQWLGAWHCVRWAAR
jgi:hypothetical protein